MSFVTLTPNPAIDRILTTEAPLVPNHLHRIAAVREAAGGKGLNVARVLATLGADVSAAGFLAGFNGRKFRSLLAADGLRGDFVEVPGETRECTIVVQPGAHPTEFNERGPSVSAADWHDLVRLLPTGSDVQYVVSGSLPPGLPAELFGGLLAELPTAPVVDSSGPALSAALAARVALVKPNRAELLAILPQVPKLKSAATSYQADPLAAAGAVYQHYGVPILLTLGENGAAYVGEEVQIVGAPSVAVSNPVASGDSLLAAFLYGRRQGLDIASSLRLGVAAGVENAVSGGGARLARTAIMERYEELSA